MSVSDVNGSRMLKQLGLSDERTQFVSSRLRLVQGAERTLHTRGRNHRIAAKKFDITKVPARDSFAAWRSRQWEEIKVIEHSLDAPSIARARDSAK